MTKKLQEALTLQERFGNLIKRERQVLNEVLDTIIEADINSSHILLGYTSLHHWLTKHFKYSDSAAWRRIDSARMKRAVPAIDKKIESGELNLSNVAFAQHAVRAEENRTQTKMSDEAKAAVVEKLEGKTGYEAQKILKTEFPEAKIFVNEKVRVLSDQVVNIQIVMTHEEYETFKRVKELLSHSIPSGSPGKILAAVCKEFVRRKDPLQKSEKRDGRSDSPKNGPHSTRSEEVVSELAAEISAAEFSDSAPIQSTVCVRPPSTTRSRHIPNPSRDMVIRRDGGRCQAVHSETGEICGSKFQIQVDHIQPWALGGIHQTGNLRCLCAFHNRQRAEQTFGAHRK